MRPLRSRVITIVGILLVATSLSARSVGTSACDCCGPLMSAPGVPAGPCCVGTAERRVLPSVTSHTVTLAAAAQDSDERRIGLSVAAPVRRGYPPGLLRPVYLSNSVLRI